MFGCRKRELNRREFVPPANWNPNFSLREVNNISDRVRFGWDDEGDYHALDFYLGAIGVERNYILNRFRERGFRHYREYLRARDTEDSPYRVIGDAVSLGFCRGVTLGAIDVLRKAAIDRGFILSE